MSALPRSGRELQPRTRAYRCESKPPHQLCRTFGEQSRNPGARGIPVTYQVPDRFHHRAMGGRRSKTTKPITGKEVGDDPPAAERPGRSRCVTTLGGGCGAAKRLRKAALRFVPLLTIAYLFNYLDRTSLGFAALTMNQQLGLSASQFGLAAGIFFLGYSLFEIPSNLLLYRFGARRWLARIMITWGLVSAATAFVVGPNSFYGLRLLLGIAEAGFFPGVTFFLAAWFPAQYRTRMLAWFLVGIPASSLVGAPVCGMLLQMNGIWGLAGWQWLFIVVSLPCIPLGLLTLYLLADRPENASWLTRDERDVLREVLSSEVRERPHSSLLAALKDTRVLILAAIQFGFTLGSYGIGIWLPLILMEYHLSTWAVAWIAAVPYVFATAGMIFWARHVDQK